MTIQEKKKKGKKSKPSAMAQVHNRVNAGIMDGITCGGMCEGAEPERNEYVIAMEEGGPEPYAHITNESTDVIPFLDIDLNNSNAYPFLTFTKKDGGDTDTFVGEAGTAHAGMPYELFSSKKLKLSDIGDSYWDIYNKENQFKSGRIWLLDDKVVASFYAYKRSDYHAMYNDIVETLVKLNEKLEAGFNIGKVIIDFYTFTRGHDDVFIPVRWLNNGIADAYFKYMTKCVPIGNDCFEMETDKGTFTLDWKGDEVESSWGVLREGKEHNFDYKKYIKSFIEFLRSQHMKIDPLPRIELKDDEQDGLFIKTGYYDPYEKLVVAYADGRHPKDVMRTIAHEFVHHMQNLQDPNKDWGSNGDLEQDRKLRGIEGEAFLLGNILFREWTEYAKKHEKNLNESRMAESPDSIFEPESGLQLGFGSNDSIPFLFSKLDNKFYIGERGETHLDILDNIGTSIDDRMRFSRNRDNVTDLKRTGRYWESEKIISFWHTSSPAVIRETVAQLTDKLGLSFRDLLLDSWERDSIFPLKWLYNGTYDMLKELGLHNVVPVRPKNAKEKSYKGGFREFEAIFNDGSIRKLDFDGDFIESNNDWYSEWGAGLYESRMSEITSELVEPDDVDLSSFNIKKHLNPKFWEDGHLDTRIRLKLLDIADDFFDSLGVDWVEPEDVIITGSLANYNWNDKYSDIDLHILVDYEDVDERVDFVREYFTLKKNEWNQKHKGLKIFGFPVEVYVQDANEPHASSGVYSIDRDEWITEPDRDKIRSGKVDKKHVRETVSTYMNKIDCLIDIYKHHKDDKHEMEQVAKDAAEMLDEIKKTRKDDLAKYAREMCDGNLIFKALRRADYIGKLIKLKNLAYDKINSL